MSTTTLTAPKSDVNPFEVDNELKLLSSRLDMSLDALLDADKYGTLEAHDAALSDLKRLSSRRLELEAVWEQHSWNRFYKDEHNSVHIDPECYAAFAGEMKLLPELSGKTVAYVRALHGSGRTCKKCSHGKS